MNTNTPSGAITISRTDPGWAPTPRDLSTTPGGSIYATTPGGTRILYDRAALLNYRNSPLSKTPTNMPVIPTGPAEQKKETPKDKKQPKSNTGKTQGKEDDELFQMEH